MKMFIDSQWIDKTDKIKVCDPFDNSLIDTVPSADAKDAEKALKAAHKGFKVSKKLTAYQRSTILRKTADYLEQRKESFANLLAKESSKTIREARKEVDRCVNTLMVSAEEAKRLNGETIPFDSYPDGKNKLGYYYRMPIGVVLAITPFNDPINLVAHKLGPAIAAGNSVILKPATVTPLSAIKLIEAFLENGLPPEMIQLITGHGSAIGDKLVNSELVRLVSFTGGVKAGKGIIAKAGIKKIGMELGSNSPVIVWKDADLDLAVKSCVSGAFWAAGQNCIGVQRLYLHQEIYDTFTSRFLKMVRQYKVGNKLLEETDMGPLITESEAIRVETTVNQAIQKGAHCLNGGKRNGAVFQPTVLENVPVDSPMHYDEIFGPVVNLYKINNKQQAIDEANSLDYGLHAAIFTRDINLALEVAYQLDCGGVMINDSTDFRLDSMPFGGVKQSGLGREGIKFSLLEMTEPKVVCFNMQ